MNIFSYVQFYIEHFCLETISVNSVYTKIVKRLTLCIESQTYLCLFQIRKVTFSSISHLVS